MGSNTPKQSERPLKGDNLRSFWQSAFLAAEFATLLKTNGKRLSPEGAAHLAAEIADCAIGEYRQRFLS